LVGIWDSGIDVALFPDQLFDDPNPTASGTHGLAFDDLGGPSMSWLHPLTPEQLKTHPETRDDIKGRPRFNAQLPALPFPPPAEWARRLGDDFGRMSDSFRTRNVRVVNMSWGDDRQE